MGCGDLAFLCGTKKGTVVDWTLWVGVGVGGGEWQ